MTLLFEKDFDTISIKEITEFAQIGRKTFYLHYIDKYDLLDQIVSEKLIELEQISEAKRVWVSKKAHSYGLSFSKIIEHFYENFNINNASNYKKKLLHFIEEEFKKKFRHVLLLKRLRLRLIY